VDKNDLPAANKNDVRLTRQLLDVERIAVAHGVEQASHANFRCGVRSCNGSHALATLFRT
jgi:hypothetical protein